MIEQHNFAVEPWALREHGATVVVKDLDELLES